MFTQFESQRAQFAYYNNLITLKIDQIKNLRREIRDLPGDPDYPATHAALTYLHLLHAQLRSLKLSALDAHRREWALANRMTVITYERARKQYQVQLKKWIDQLYHFDFAQSWIDTHPAPEEPVDPWIAVQPSWEL